MRILFSTSAAPLGLAWPNLADEQLFCGPLQLDLDLDGQVFSRRTPVGDFDLAALVAALPAAQRPDIVAVVADGLTVAWPRNLACCEGSRVLLVGDSQNSPEGLARLIDYARSEPFDRIVFTQGCLDEPFFRAAGLGALHWFPGLLSAVRDDLLSIVRQADRTQAISVPSATRAAFSAANVQIEALSRAKLAVVVRPEHAEVRLEQLGRNLVAAIPSEHGEWSQAFFEALAAGALVVTGNLGKKAGLDRVWPNGSPFLMADTAEDVAAICAVHVANPSESAELRGAAMAWYDNFLGERPRREAFWALVREGRPAVPPSQTTESEAINVNRSELAALSWLHLAFAASCRPTVFVAEGVPAARSAVCERLPRLQLARECPALGRAIEVAIGTLAARVALLRWNEAGATVPAGHSGFDVGSGRSVDQKFLTKIGARETAWTALERGDYPRALEAVKALTAQFPDDIDAHLIAADLFYEAGSSAGLNQHLTAIRRLNPRESRLAALIRRCAAGPGMVALRQAQAAWRCSFGQEPAAAAKALGPAIDKFPNLLSVQVAGAHLFTLAGQAELAIEAWYLAARHHPNEDELWFQLGLALWRAGRRAEAGFALRRAADHAPHVEGHRRAFTAARRLEPSIPDYVSAERDLIIASSENCQKHGAGVLMKRIVGSQMDVISLRPATHYAGVEECGTTNLCLPFEELPMPELETRIRRLLAPYKIRRIISVPFDRETCLYTSAAHEVTGARLCAYVMDDRNVLTPATPDHVLEDVFRRSSLRLAISSELQMAYMIKFDYDFEVLPPIVSDRQARRENNWTPKVRPPTHGALVGSIWTSGQLVQMVKFVGRSGLTLDWFGRPPKDDLSGTGINVMGFVSEAELADRLTSYPFVVVPSGLLDGTEDNEWLTRLSLPSRICFLLQTRTPILVLGNKDTCASRHVTHLGIGRVMPYNHPNPAQVLSEFTAPSNRANYLKSAAAAADGFVMPDAGQWIWESLDAGVAQPAPFHQFMEVRPAMEVLWPTDAAGRLPISHDAVFAA